VVGLVGATHDAFFLSLLHCFSTDLSLCVGNISTFYASQVSLSNRLTRLTNSCLLKGESQPVCEACHSPLTVKHFLVDCTCYSAAHQRYFGVDTRTFLKMLHLATSSLMLKISAFTIVY